MSREIWLKTEVRGFNINAGRLVPIAYCGHHLAEDGLVHSTLADPSRAASLECWARGMINSSSNILIKGADGVLAPLGKAGGEGAVRYGILVEKAKNEYSRDKPLEYVSARRDAQRLCQLEQTFPGCDFTAAQLAVALGMDVPRASDRLILNLVRVMNAWLALRERTLKNIDLKEIKSELDKIGS